MNVASKAWPYYLAEVCLLFLCVLIFKQPEIYVIYAVLAVALRWWILRHFNNGSIERKEQKKADESGTSFSKPDSGLY